MRIAQSRSRPFGSSSSRGTRDLLVGEREVDLAVGAQLVAQIFGQHAQHEVLDVILIELRLAGDRDQLAVDSHQRRTERGDQQVAAAAFPQDLEVALERGNRHSTNAHWLILRLVPMPRPATSARAVGRPDGRPTGHATTA